MNHEDRDPLAARRTGDGHRQGRLTATRDRPDRPAGRSSRHDRFRLKRSLEIFEATDGDIYLLRLGAGEDLAIRSPTADERALLRAIDGDFLTIPDLGLRLGARFTEEALAATVAELVQAGLVEVRRANRPLSAREAERLDRQLVYLAELAAPGESADDLQARLARATVAIIGCGGLGSWVACGLSELGVGSLVLIDDDRVELSNLNRQILFREDQLGELKVEAAAVSLRAHNSALTVDRLACRIDGPSDLEAILDTSISLVVNTGDWPPHGLPRWVNAACAELGIPWIGAGQFPPRLRVGPLVIPGVSACLECLETDARTRHPLYDDVASHRDTLPRPDPSVGPISALIGSLIACEALHLLTGATVPASVGHALLVDVRSMTLERVPVPRNPACATCAGGYM